MVATHTAFIALAGNQRPEASGQVGEASRWLQNNRTSTTRHHIMSKSQRRRSLAPITRRTSWEEKVWLAIVHSSLNMRHITKIIVWMFYCSCILRVYKIYPNSFREPLTLLYTRAIFEFVLFVMVNTSYILLGGREGRRNGMKTESWHLFAM